MCNFTTEVLKVTKTTKVVKEGKIIKFKVMVVTGNFKDQVGLGIGKHEKLEEAINKAVTSSYKNIFVLSDLILFNNTTTIPFLIKSLVKKTLLIAKPIFEDKGIKSNYLSYLILKLAGVENISVKLIGSNNSLNIIYATFDLLKNLKSYIYFKNKMPDVFRLFNQKNSSSKSGLNKYNNKIKNKRVNFIRYIKKRYNLNYNNFIKNKSWDHNFKLFN